MFNTTNIFSGELATVYPNTDSLGYVNWTDRGPASFPVHPWWIGSIAEATFLLGAERNSEKIIGAAYVRSVLQAFTQPLANRSHRHQQHRI
jgi:hypothetical protein